MKQPASAMLSIALSLTLVTGMCPATALATGNANAQATTNATAAETPAADATNSSQSTADNHSESAAAEPAAQSSENAIATAATTSTYAHTATAEQNGVTFTVNWDDAAAGQPTTFHVTQTGGSANAKARMDVPTYKDTDGSKESVCDPSRNQWAGAQSYKTIGDSGCDFTFEFTASGSYNIYFYFMDTTNNIGYLRITDLWVTVDDPARPSVTQIVNNAVAQCRQETSGSEYDMALWLHDWTLNQLEYDHSLNYCSAESGLTRHQGTCESYQRIYAKLLNAAGIANGRITGNGHTWNAVKIDSKWCQMDLTWDDTSNNWYGDLDQRHLYFGLTDELMAIAHSDHTKNYQAEDYAYRSTDLSNNYFVRNGKADEWAGAYADRIQKHLNAKETEFSIDADNQSFPPSISGIQNGIIAYAMNQREWSTNSVKADFTATSSVTTQSSSRWTAKYDFTAKYVSAAPIPDGSYKIMSMIDESAGILASESDCSMSKAPRALDFKFDAATGQYLVTSGDKALTLNGTALFLATPDGSASQQWTLTEVNGGYALINAASGNAIDDRWRDTSEEALVWGYTSNPGDPAQTWTLATPSEQTVADGSFRIMSLINGSMGVSVLEGGCEMSSAAGYLNFKFDVGTGLYTLTSAGNALTMEGAELSLKPADGSASQQWSIIKIEGNYALVNAASGNAIDDRWRDTSEGALVWGYGSSLGDQAQTWTLKAPEEQTIEDGEYRILSGLDSRMAVKVSDFGCTLKSSAEAIRFERDDATGYYKLSKGDLSLTADGSTAYLAKPNGKGTQLWKVGEAEDGYTITNAANGMALDAKWCAAAEGSEVWLYSTNATKAQTWYLKKPETRAVADGFYNIMSTINGIAGVSASEFGCTMSQTPCAFRFEYFTETGLYRITISGKALKMSGANIFLAKTDGAPNEQWSVVRVDGGYALINAASGNAVDDRWRNTNEGALIWGYGSSLGDQAQTWALVPITS